MPKMKKDTEIIFVTNEANILFIIIIILIIMITKRPGQLDIDFPNASKWWLSSKPVGLD